MIWSSRGQDELRCAIRGSASWPWSEGIELENGALTRSRECVAAERRAKRESAAIVLGKAARLEAPVAKELLGEFVRAEFAP